MLYRPPQGRMKDSVTFYDDGRFYMFSMYSADASGDDYCRVWLAESEDGVHYSDVGAVICAPFKIWAMGIARIGGKYLLNHGTFAEDGSQSVIRFWESDNLKDWQCRLDLDLRPDPRWFAPNSRLDCMDIVQSEEDGKTVYYGFATGPSGFWKSTDGHHWESLGPVDLDWSPYIKPLSCALGDFEVGGCRRIGKKWYLVGGCFNFLGMNGYGTCTLQGDSPQGPFRPDGPRFRLYGGSGRWVSFWSRFCNTPNGLLVSNSYIYTGHSYEQGETWLPPLKRALTTDDGHLYLAYWEGNDRAKAQPLAPCPDALLQSPPMNVFTKPALESSMAIQIIETAFDPTCGMMLEGVFQIDVESWTDAAPGAGFYLEETPTSGTAIILMTSGVSLIGNLKMENGQPTRFVCENEIPPFSASAVGAEANRPMHFRLMARHGMFELYLDNRHAATFNTAHTPDAALPFSGRFGWLAIGGKARFNQIKAWTMNL